MLQPLCQVAPLQSTCAPVRFACKLMGFGQRPALSVLKCAGVQKWCAGSVTSTNMSTYMTLHRNHPLGLQGSPVLQWGGGGW